MRSRLLWLAVMIAAIAGFYYMTIRPALTPASPRIPKRMLRDFQPPEVGLPPLPAPSMEMPTLTPPPIRMPTMTVSERRLPPTATTTPGEPPEVPIQSGATIDFSLGTPQIRRQADDDAAMARALEEMSEAVKDVTFQPGEKSRESHDPPPR